MFGLIAYRQLKSIREPVCYSPILCFGYAIRGSGEDFVGFIQFVVDHQLRTAMTHCSTPEVAKTATGKGCVNDVGFVSLVSPDLEDLITV